MNSTAAFNTEAEIGLIFASENSTSLDAPYATAPMAAVVPAYQPPSEEELHSSFEEAISGRLLAVHNRLERLNSRPVIAYTTTGSLQHPAIHQELRSFFQQPEQPLAHQSSWKKIIIYIAFASIFLLIGFDLMGLLVLHLH